MLQHNGTYDDEGNRLTKTKISTGEKEEYTWDHRNRLTKITFKNSGGTVLKTVDQTYDYLNQWIRRSVDNDGPGSGVAVDTFFSHEGGQVALQFGGTTAASLSHRYFWNPAAIDELLVDEQVTSLASAGALQYPLGDHLGTLRDLATYNAGTNTTTIDNHRRYDSYGNLTSETNAAVDQLFGYTGRALDESTGLQNNLNRWHDSKVGIWLSEDPIGFAGDPSNRYRYVSNAPLSAVDPAGLVEGSASIDYTFTKEDAVFNSFGTLTITKQEITVRASITYDLDTANCKFKLKDANVSIVKATYKIDYYRPGNLQTPSRTVEGALDLNDGHHGYEVSMIGVPQVDVTARPDGGLDWKVDVNAELYWTWAGKKRKDTGHLGGPYTFKFSGGTIGPCAGR